MRDGDPRDVVGPLRARLAAGTLSVAEAVWLFLASRRGELFCSLCLMTVLGTNRRIDKALMAAEGRGALRRYRPCSLCGKDRLVSGLAPA